MLHRRFADTAKAFGQLGMDVSEEEARQAADELAQVEQPGAEDRVDRPRQASADCRVRLLHLPADLRVNVPFYYGPTLLGSYFSGGTSTAVSAAWPALR